MKRFVSIVLISCLGLLTAQSQSTKVLLKTTLGDMTIVLYDDTPLHKDNFETLVKDKFFDGLIFHRVMENFMIQSGNPNTRNHKKGEAYRDGSQGSTIPAEFRANHIHKKGALAAARRGQGNPNKESSGSQFYIVHGTKMNDALLSQMQAGRSKPLTKEEIKIYKELGGYPPLDYEYTIFGEVTEGLDVIDKIAAVKTVSKRVTTPIDDVIIISARIIK
ncbi:MAG: peptidylprolyl isomerase [Bacteroidales bacterium]|nr:peptidylprolyl isomerase [Bacteroidales bacterium]